MSAVTQFISTQLHAGTHPQHPTSKVWHTNTGGAYWLGWAFDNMTPRELAELCESTLEDLAANHPDLTTATAQRDTAWNELREIRAMIGADEHEATSDEVRRVVNQRNELHREIMRLPQPPSGSGDGPTERVSWIIEHDARATAGELETQRNYLKLLGSNFKALDVISGLLKHPNVYSVFHMGEGNREYCTYCHRFAPDARIIDHANDCPVTLGKQIIERE